MNGAPQVNSGKLTDACSSADLATADQIDLLCDAYEQAWRRGESPHIEAYLEQCDETARESLLAELLLVDRELLIRRGKTACRVDYQRRFPQYSTVIDNLELPTIDDRGDRRLAALDSSSVPFAGMKLAHFELLEELGSGASGTVWKAKDSRLRRTVAIKIPRQGSLTDQERERFLREGQACAQLRYPNIVAVYDVGEDHGRAFIVAEYIDGLSLRDWLKQRRPKPREAAELAAQLAEALHHAHQQGVIHRDLKPANILMDGEGRPHVTDFGLAKWTADTALMTVEGNILGTPAYMSPEQARGDAAKVDRRSDLYGLGALLYEMLTGQPPFEGDIATIVHKVVHDEPAPPRKVVSGISRNLETICLKAMEKDPSRRYPSAQEMAVDLRRYLRNEPILARRSGVVERSWRWARRRPAVTVSILMFAIATFAFSMLGILARKNHELLGLRAVTLATEPSGAKVVFVPLNETTGEPMPDKIIRVRGRSPVSEELAPGDYLVIAAIDDRFHEVYRHVPFHDDTRPLPYKHMRWRTDASAAVVLPSIRIPERQQLDDMVLVSLPQKIGHTGVTAELASAGESSLLVDIHEVTVGQYRKVTGGRVPLDARYVLKPDDYPITLSWDEAVHIAERMGKRLPTEDEFSQLIVAVSSELDRSRPFPSNGHASNFGIISVESARRARIGESQFLFGLLDNAAEWTHSPPTFVDGESRTGTDQRHLSSYRIVRAGNMETINGADTAAASIEQTINARIALPRHTLKPGLGFRCVRSVEPQFAVTE